MSISNTDPLQGLRPWRKRVELTATSLSLIVAAILLFFYNGTYWSKAEDVFSGHPLQMIIFGVVIYGLTLAFFAMFSFRPIIKVFLICIIMLTAVTSYYMDSLGVIIDRDMIQNVATTTFTESKHLLTWNFIIHTALFGLLPALLLIFVRVRKQRWMPALGLPVLLFVLGLSVAVGGLMSNFKTYSSVLRERKDFMASYQPGAPIVGAMRYAKMMLRSANPVVVAIGEDARKGATYTSSRKPILTILVAGETARAQNFSLNGYDVPTNPELETRNVINFSDVTSCGTATAVSLPCMFSRYRRDEYSFGKGVSTEGLLDVLVHAGFAVEWWDNNTGSKAIADRIPNRSLTQTENVEFCAAGECIDGIFLDRLRAFVPTINQDTVLVFHQIGSHGPTYHLRYPPEFARFQPACETAELIECTTDEVRNAYDNTILYTDHVLAETIDYLETQTGLATNLLYVSDHGESLGESGLFLHGAPYFMAPDEQTKVPMILWMSDIFKKQLAIPSRCISAKTDAPLSHDNVFHSVLGMLNVETTERDPALDLFADCRTSVLVASQ